VTIVDFSSLKVMKIMNDIRKKIRDELEYLFPRKLVVPVDPTQTFEDALFEKASKWMFVEVFVLDGFVMAIVISCIFLGLIALIGFIPMLAFIYFAGKNRFNYAYIFMMNWMVCRDVGYDEAFIKQVEGHPILKHFNSDIVKYQHLLVDR